ncbi:MAG: hypothetical protein A2W26_08610 [Acidobacteria bacterium RBG_16_64_8]|nr:MAG: hypothetical protein A2W26_08610 [Acidobacteria bacterium RBG_16_64_8]
MVAITFDDGPDAEVTPRLLDVLRRHRAYATFFMVGQAAARYPDIVRRVAEEGHAIGNHSWDHTSFRLLSGRERRANLRACERAIAPYDTHRLFRPPLGEQSLMSRIEALVLGYTVVTWSVSTNDWHGEEAQALAEQLIRAVRPGEIVLLHDSLIAPQRLDPRRLDRAPTLRAVETLLERCRGSLLFVTVPELVRHGRPERQLWFWPAAY